MRLTWLVETGYYRYGVQRMLSRILDVWMQPTGQIGAGEELSIGSTLTVKYKHLHGTSETEIEHLVLQTPKSSEILVKRKCSTFTHRSISADALDCQHSKPSCFCDHKNLTHCREYDPED